MIIFKHHWTTWGFLVLLLYSIFTKSNDFEVLFILLMWITSILLSIEINCRKDKKTDER